MPFLTHSRKLARAAFVSILLLTIALLLIRACLGPIPGLISPRTTLNFEAAAFLALCGTMLFTRTKKTGIDRTASLTEASVFVPVVAIALLTVATYSPGLSSPFVFDDYRHLTSANSENFGALLKRVLLEHPTAGDFFFRPLGDSAFFGFYQWAHLNFYSWHLAGLCLHLAATVLVWLLARRLCGGYLGAFAAASVFAVHASHVEVVTWISAFYDLLATLFVLLSLLIVTSNRKTVWEFASLTACAAAACTSKEAAYCLPLLACVLVGFVSSPLARSLAFKKTFCVSIVCACVFAYRFWYLGGLGGYQASSGGSMASHLSPLSALQAVTLRLWAILFVPLNWSVPPALALKFGFVCLSVAVIGFAWVATLAPRRAALFAAFTLCAALPAIPLLLIGLDLEGARVLYLPSVGAALLWGEITQSVQNRRVASVLLGFLLIFQLTALRHNERVWVDVSHTARQACLDAGTLLHKDPNATLYAWKLPRSRDGVFFLQNAFADCVAINASVDAHRITAGNDLPAFLPPNTRVVIWNEQSGHLTER